MTIDRRSFLSLALVPLLPAPEQPEITIKIIDCAFIASPASLGWSMGGLFVGPDPLGPKWPAELLRITEE